MQNSTHVGRQKRPLPIANLHQVLVILGNVAHLFEPIVVKGLFEAGAQWTKRRQAVNHVADQVEKVEVIKHDHGGVGKMTRASRLTRGARCSL